MCYTKHIKNICSNIYSSGGVPFLMSHLSYRNFLICKDSTSVNKYCISVNNDISLLKHSTFFIDYKYSKWTIERPSSSPHRAIEFLEDIINQEKHYELESIVRTEQPIIYLDSPRINTKINIPRDTLSTLYSYTCIDYIQIKKYGLYHTGKNIGNFKVPMFECNQEIVFTPYVENKNIRLLMSIKIKNNDLTPSRYSLDISEHYALPDFLYLGLK